MSAKNKAKNSMWWERWRQAGAIGTIIVKKILVWSEGQRVPATLYGDAHFGKGCYIIMVCKNPNDDLEKLGKENALIYHFR